MMGVTEVPSRLGAYSKVPAGRAKMQKGERKLWKVLKFRLIEKTVGRLLQAIIQRLEDERTRFVNECIPRMPH